MKFGDQATDVLGGFCIEMIKVTAPPRKVGGGVKEKREETMSEREASPISRAQHVELDLGKSIETELH